MSQQKVRVGIVGASNVSRIHEAGYTEIDDLCELTAFCDIDEEKAHSRAKPYQARVYTNYQHLLADAEIDMIDITVPHRLRFPIALAALGAGKHVRVEKPIAMTSAQARQLIEVAQHANMRFTFAEHAHFVAAYQEAKRLLQTNTLGEVRFVRASSTGSENDSSCSEISQTEGHENQRNLLDAGIHTFYLLKWLFGGVTDIQAIAYKLLPESPMNDHALAIGHLVNGAVFATIQSCASEAPWSERLEIHGSLGSLIIDQFTNPPAIYFHGSNDGGGTPLIDVPYEPLAWKYLSIVAEVQDFVRSVIEERLPLIDPFHGYHALQVIEAAYRSINEKTTVSLLEEALSS